MTAFTCISRWHLFLLRAGGWTGWPLEVPSDPNYSVMFLYRQTSDAQIGWECYVYHKHLCTKHSDAEVNAPRLKPGKSYSVMWSTSLRKANRGWF